MAGWLCCCWWCRGPPPASGASCAGATGNNDDDSDCDNDNDDNDFNDISGTPCRGGIGHSGAEAMEHDTQVIMASDWSTFVILASDWSMSRCQGRQGAMVRTQSRSAQTSSTTGDASNSLSTEVKCSLYSKAASGDPLVRAKNKKWRILKWRKTQNSAVGNTSIWGSLPKFSTGYFQVILDEVRSGQVMTRDLETSDISFITTWKYFQY